MKKETQEQQKLQQNNIEQQMNIEQQQLNTDQQFQASQSKQEKVRLEKQQEFQEHLEKQKQRLVADKEEYLNKQEEDELKQLRIDVQVLEKKIYLLENELFDVQMRMANLNKWKRGRWYGFTITFLAFAITLGVMFNYSYFQYAAMTGMNSNGIDAFGYSVSTTVLIFSLILLLVFGIMTIYFGFKAMIEVGSSKTSRAYAKSHYEKNYYNEMEECLEIEHNLKVAIIELKEQNQKKKNRIQELEMRERPWFTEV